MQAQPGAGVTFTYDNVGRVATRTDSVHGTLTYTYDNLDRVKNVAYPDGTSESLVYNNLDLQSSTDRQRRTTAYTYDSDRRLTIKTDPKLQATRYAWCACGSMISMTDPKGNMTDWAYDLEGRVTQKSYPDGSIYTYGYDPVISLLTQMADPKQQVTQYVYDVDNKLTAVDYLGAKNPTAPVAYQYDLFLGRLIQMTDGTGISTYSYYPIGQTGGNQIKTISQPVGANLTNITYTYDADGRVISRSIDGVQESYGINGAGQLIQVSNPLGGFVYSYDPNSARLTQVAYPNGQQVNFDYFTSTDPNGASGSLKDISNIGGGATSGQTLSKFSYAYNPTGEINTWNQQLDNNPADAKTYRMGYDNDSQLQGVTLISGTSGFDGLTAGKAVTYGYDAAGNRTTEFTPNYFHNFGTNNLNQLTGISPNPIMVSATTNRPASVLVNATPVAENSSNQFQIGVPSQGGNQTPLTVVAVAKDGTVASQTGHVLNTSPYTYDANGNLLKDDQRTYTWDAANRLISVSYINAQPATVADTVQMTYDGLGRRVGITELHSGTVLVAKTFVWCVDQMSQERDVTGHTVTKQFFALGEQINGSKYYFAKDHLGSVREMTDSNGTVQASYDYNPWGRQTQLDGTLQADFGYTGFYVEWAARLNLSLFRAYDPEKGRWLGRDPMGESTGPNLYSYCLNEILNRIDPSGLISLGGIGTGGAFGGVGGLFSGVIGNNLGLNIGLGLAGAALLATIPLSAPLWISAAAGAIVSGGIDAFYQYKTHTCHNINPWEVGYATATGGVLGLLGGWAGGAVEGAAFQQFVGGLVSLPYGMLASVGGSALFPS